jgi:hypothetical protein
MFARNTHTHLCVNKRVRRKVSPVEDHGRDRQSDRLLVRVDRHSRGIWLLAAGGLLRVHAPRKHVQLPEEPYYEVQGTCLGSQPPRVLWCFSGVQRHERGCDDPRGRAGRRCKQLAAKLSCAQLWRCGAAGDGPRIHVV